MMPEDVSQVQGQLLLAMARGAIAEKLPVEWSGPETDRKLDKGFLALKRGVFVTLHKKGRLRGCIGTIEPVSSIGEAVCENARYAAFKDSRFSPLKPEEFCDIDIEISLLSLPEPLAFSSTEDLTAALVPHRDGVVLKKGTRRATFLPQVWEQLPTAPEFLTQLSLKAGLTGQAWKDDGLEILVYRVQSFGELSSGTCHGAKA